MTRAAAGAAAGLLLTAGLPPFGWWPLAIAGAALTVHLLDGVHGQRRAAVAFAVALGWLAPGLFWMTEFTAPGYVLAVLFESVLVTIGLVAGRGRVGLPAAIVVAEALRASWPWGGVPVPTIAQTQIGGPVAQAARVGGELLITLVVVVAGVAVVALVRRQWTAGGGCAAAVIVVTAIGIAAPRGDPAGTIDVAAVQGGGERGTRAVDTDERIVFDRHVEASGLVDEADLILWPEDVVDVGSPIDETEEGAELAALARAEDATVLAGIVQGSDEAFVNFVQAWAPDGEVLGTYEKNTRVPFGEFIPFRSIVEQLADVSAVPRDARAGHGPGFIETPAADVAITISWEVFFADRARDGVSTGGEVLLVPTNASSFSTTQMPALELGAARLRAIETGRDLVQAAPTGFSAIVSSSGEVQRHSDLGDRAVLHGTVTRRRGTTVYTRLGDGPFVVGALVALAWTIVRARAGASPDRR